jgi:hypothetical protein
MSFVLARVLTKVTPVLWLAAATYYAVGIDFDARKHSSDLSRPLSGKICSEQPKNIFNSVAVTTCRRPRSFFLHTIFFFSCHEYFVRFRGMTKILSFCLLLWGSGRSFLTGRRA